MSNVRIDKQTIKGLPLYKTLSGRELLVPEGDWPIMGYALGKIHYIRDIPLKQTSYQFRANVKDDFAPEEGRVDVFAREYAKVLDFILGTSYEMQVDPLTRVVQQVTFDTKALLKPKQGGTRYSFTSAGPHREVHHTPATQIPNWVAVTFDEKGGAISKKPVPENTLLPELNYVGKDGAIFLRLENGALKGSIRVRRSRTDVRPPLVDISDKALLQRTYIQGVATFNEVIEDLQLNDVLNLDLTGKHYKDA